MSVSNVPKDGEHRLSMSCKAAFASGAVTYGVGYFIIMQLAYPVLNLSLGISATLIGLVLALGRLWDAITDPLVGWWSDKSWTRWGRRKPFLLAGALLMVPAAPLLWAAPREWSHEAQLIWFGVAGLLFYLGATLFCVPWLSMSYEMTPDSQERTRLHAWRAYVGAGIGLVLPWMFRWTQADVFADPGQGAVWVSAAAGLGALLAALPVLIFCRERPEGMPVRQESMPFWPSLRATLGNRPFLCLELGIVTVVLATPILVGALGTYVNTFYVYGGDAKAGAALTALHGSMFVLVKVLVLPVAVKLAGRFGKVRLMGWSLMLGFIGSVSQFFLVRPELPYLQLLSALLLSPAYTAFWLLVDPMKADCADYDECRTGLRREGSYASVANWIEKVAVTLVLALSGWLLDAAGFDPQRAEGQTDETMFFLRLAWCAVPAVGFLVALGALRAYGLDETRMARVREETRRKWHPPAKRIEYENANVQE